MKRFGIAAVAGLAAVTLALSPAKAQQGSVSLTGLATTNSVADTIQFNPAGSGIAQIQNSTATGILAPVFPGTGTTNVQMIGWGTTCPGGCPSTTLNFTQPSQWIGNLLFGSGQMDARITSFTDTIGPGAAGLESLTLAGNAVFTVAAAGGQPGFSNLPGTWEVTTQLVPGGNFGFNTTFSAAVNPVPGPIVGAGLPGLIAALGGLVAMARRRRNQLA